MATRINIHGIIGWYATGRTLRRQLRRANGDDIEIHLRSPGGRTSDALLMHNIIRQYSLDKDKGSVTVNIDGMVAGIASYIPLAADEVTANDDAVYMINNKVFFTDGGKISGKAQKERDQITESIRRLIANAYAAKSRRPYAEIVRLMSDELYLYGPEIIYAGYVDRLRRTGRNLNEPESAVRYAQSVVAKMVELLRRFPPPDETVGMRNITEDPETPLIDQAENEPIDDR